MTKRILSIMLAFIMVLSFATVVNADALQTFTLGEAEIDATSLNVGDTLSVPVTATAFPADVIYAGQLDVTFDKDVLKMKTVDVGIKGADEYGDPATIRWANTALINNANTTGSASFNFLDTDLGVSKKYTSAMSGTIFTINFEVLADTANTTISLNNAKLSDYSTGDEVKYEVANGTVAVSGDSIVKFVADAEPAEVNWATGTDAGFYTVDEDVFGLMRFLFDVSTEGVVTETGIKYLKAEDITATITGAEVSGAATTFYGDVVAIPEGTAGTYYAAAYAVVDGETRWSAPVACTPDFVKAVIK